MSGGADLQTQSGHPEAASAGVLLVHGIWNTAHWLLPLARRLRAAGMTQSSHRCYRGLEVDLYEHSAGAK